MAQPVTFSTAAATLPESQQTPEVVAVGMSQRAAAHVRKMSAERHAQRAAEDARIEAEAAAYHREFLNRKRAAEFLGVSVHRLKRLTSAGTGPACVKSGDAKQSPVRWALSELSRWKANPRGYRA